MSVKKILDRVKKMLAIANDAGATEGERDNALRMSYNLLAKHNLSMADLPTEESNEARERQDTHKTILAILFVLAALGFAGASDYDEAVRQEAEYCDAVHHGKWPDYRGDYRQSCLNGIPRQ